MEDNWTIYKYQIPITDESTFDAFPTQHRVLAVKCIGKLINIWAMVNVGGPTQRLTFRVVGTGHPLTEDEVLHMFYVGTTFSHDDALVWHVFVNYPAIGEAL